ncbi:MAG: pilus assembly protein N-terminal domain-containing protein [Alphaproteobacteria bacterium]|nr:pilus assembly protein N-terminal domain-containing protein [Alphaproteobacteria bacterium]MCB9691655.1 pilus assembly protein N-terminal domain-containing protein [Alphaproteobacteria bacterium]
MRSPKALLTGLVGILFSTALVSTTALAQEERADWLDIELGKSAYLETPQTPTSLAITDPTVANIQNLGLARKFQVQGTAIGTTDLLVNFGPGVPPMTYEVTVHRDLTELVRRIDSIVEGEAPRVYPLEERIVVEGPVDDLDTLEQVALVARIYDEDFVNLMSVRGDHQVQLEVLFAEVSREAIREMGLNVLWGTAQLGAGLSQGGTQQPSWTNAGLAGIVGGGGATSQGVGVPTSSSSVMSIGAVVQAINLVAVAQLLDEYRMGKILAQPTLVSLSGQEAEFLAGGQTPIPQPTGQGQISIVFKDYGVRLQFVPTVLAGNIIDVRMTVEVSEIDYSTGLPIAGISVPGFVTRKARTHLRIESGKTFAVAGLLNENSSFFRKGIPGLGRIPIIGVFFRGVRHERSETEVVIYVTPRLVRPLAAGEVPPAPGTTENNNPSDLELFLLGTGSRPGSRTAEPTGVVGLQR